MLPQPGTFADHLFVSRDQIFAKPAHLSAEQAAALPLAGLTAYRAVITRGGVHAGSNVLITGIGQSVDGARDCRTDRGSMIANEERTQELTQAATGFYVAVGTRQLQRGQADGPSTHTHAHTRTDHD